MTRTPWQILGLEPGADAREVKRAYARLLKETRPEADPDRFQAIRWAYELALAHLAQLAGREADADEKPAGPPNGVRHLCERSLTPLLKVSDPIGGADGSAALARVEGLELPALRPVDEVVASLRDALFRGPDAVLAQIERTPELVSLDARMQVESRLLQALVAERRFPRPDALEWLAAHFRWSEIESARGFSGTHNAEAFDLFWRRTLANDEIRRRARFHDDETWYDALAIRCLVTPWAWWKSVFMLPTRAWAAVAQPLADLRRRYGHGVDALLDEGSVRRVERLSDRKRINRDQLAITGGRSLVVGVLVAAFVLHKWGAKELALAGAAAALAGVALLATDAVRALWHWNRHGMAWLAGWRGGESTRMQRALPWALPLLRALGAAVPAFVAASLDGVAARVLAAFGALLLLTTSGTVTFAIADTVGVLFWGFALGLVGMRPWYETAPVFAAAIGVVALLRELTFMRFAERVVTEHLVIQRRATLLAAVPIFVMIALKLWRDF
ncbi:MAG TPA: J domain-containing protein [Xanthomonadales bacterium]|nr:J domain-containing protein [Xanthomonadales bacterium]